MLAPNPEVLPIPHFVLEGHKLTVIIEGGATLNAELRRAVPPLHQA